MDEEEREDGRPAPLERGHVRIWRNSKRERQWSVTVGIGVSQDEADAALQVAQGLAERLEAGR